jgi:hypothetical protein
MNDQFDVNIDYLTITSDRVQDIGGFVEAFQKSIPMEAGGRPFRWRDYVGEVYVADEGHLAWGIKPGHGLCQMSGDWSDRVFRHLDAFRLLDYRCTRLDLAVTVALPVPRQLVRDALALPALAGGNYSAITKTNGEGGTLYVGCRKSDQFGRLYDKGAEIRSRLSRETVPDAVLWRYEVEYKRSLAQAQRDDLARLVQDHERLDAVVAARVHDWFLKRNVPPAFVPDRRDSSVVSVATRVTNVQKSLEWYRVQVRPSIARASAEVSTEAILEALGVEVDGWAWVRTSHAMVTPFQFSLWEEGPEQL